MKKYLPIILSLLALLFIYFCMAQWGLGSRNAIKYYLYAAVILCSFLLVKNWQQLKQVKKGSYQASSMFIITASLILATITAGLFNQYEMNLYYTEMRDHPKRTKGVVIKHERKGKQRQYYAIFRYEHENKKYTNSFLDPQKKWEAGDSVTVLYTPRFPHNSGAEIPYE